MRLYLVLVMVFAVVMALRKPQDLPEFGQLAFLLNEDKFEDYLDYWLDEEHRKYGNVSHIESRSGCTFRVNGDLGHPQPVYIYRNYYLVPNGNTGQIRLNTGEQVIIACTGYGHTIRHPNIASTVSVGAATCVGNNLVSGSGWLNGNRAFGGLTCSAAFLFIVVP